MLRILDIASRRGRKMLERLDRRNEGVLDPRIVRKTQDILEGVRLDGDAGLLRAVRRFDGERVRRVGDLSLKPAVAPADALPAGFEEALHRSIAAVRRYHEGQVRAGHRTVRDGIELVERRIALRRVGVYVPGGRAAYPSTAVMTVVPAQLAGVREIVVTTPLGSWRRSAALRHTLAVLGVREIWGLGGAHAIAALAYGTETLSRVDKIVGPGNAWVTAAKHLVSADVGIDGLAGPSEVVIIATGDAVPGRLAADLLAQAEHDPQATALLITDRRALAVAVDRELRRQLPLLATKAVAKRSLATTGGAIIVPDMEAALTLAERIAPEHLQLVGAEAEILADRVTRSGAIFVGSDTPEVFGDYIAGPSHVLPTGGTARYASALGVEDFVRRSHVVRYERRAAQRQALAAAVLADVEGLPAHAAAARMRRSEEGAP